jgi:hypothetical protein
MTISIKELRETLRQESPPMDTPERVQWRMEAVFGLFFDDEEGEPDQAICDVLTDVLHIAKQRGVDFAKALDAAGHMAWMEREEWKMTATAEVQK